jgi:hypothetical protein
LNPALADPSRADDIGRVKYEVARSKIRKAVESGRSHVKRRLKVEENGRIVTVGMRVLF